MLRYISKAMSDKLWGSLKPIIEDTNDEKEKEKLIKILMPCIIELLIKPRYKWIALIGFLFKAIKDSSRCTPQAIDKRTLGLTNSVAVFYLLLRYIDFAWIMLTI